MRVTVVYLGGSKGQTGCSQEQLELPAGATVQEVADAVAARHPALAGLLQSVRWARNFEFARASEELADGDELALLPPVSGGAPTALLTTEPLDPESVRRHVEGDDIGATVSFVGTVRNRARGQDIRRLEYEAYEPMAQRQLERISQECADDGNGTRVFIAHRHGHLEVGDISVVIAAASPHRAAAFDACRRAIERIKDDVPIWKREVAENGATWVGWGGG